MDVVHVALDLYSPLWKFAPPRQCHPSMPKLSLGGDSFDVDEPEMIVDPTGTIARHVAWKANSCVFLTPSFTMDQVTAGCVSRCRLRFPPAPWDILSHKIFVYREGRRETTTHRYIRYPSTTELILDVQISSEGLTVNRVNPLGANDECPVTTSWKSEGSADSTQISHRMWLGVYTYGIGDVTLEGS
eukprot:PhF_6_TR10045/c0_g1_i4/m.15462